MESKAKLLSVNFVIARGGVEEAMVVIGEASMLESVWQVTNLHVSPRLLPFNRRRTTTRKVARALGTRTGRQARPSTRYIAP
jgi:hypothetical protein